MGQYCFARCMPASSVVVCNACGQSATAGLCAWPVQRPTLHSYTPLWWHLVCVDVYFVTDACLLRFSFSVCCQEIG